MLNKRILLGSLVAGALLLPMTSNAGVVSGPCVNCHTMHSTDGDGGNRTGGAVLMGGSSCAECHAAGVGNDATTGTYNNGSFAAPQVDDSNRPNLAGYFSVGAADPLGSTQQHNPSSDLGNPETVNGGTAPGGGAAAVTLTTCAECHVDGQGGHHGGSVDSYRMLFSKSVTGLMGADDNYGGRATGTGVPDTTNTTYDATSMNGVCNTCHGEFHGMNVGEQLDAAGNWIKHPTGIGIGEVNDQYNYTTNYTAVLAADEQDYVPLGSVASSPISSGPRTDGLMCITCHYSHGGPNRDLLRFAYDARFSGVSATGNNQAGDNRASIGCESCHTYVTVTGQNGM